MSDPSPGSLFGGEALSQERKSSLWPILMRPDDVVPMKRAVDLTGRDERTLRNWNKRYRVGRQSSKSAPIEFSAPALVMILHGDTFALEELRKGNRMHPSVVRYFEFLGIPV
ncbi:hypothetical protein SAMN05216228_1008119 [Rhizobium tibeticum]|uniref:Uncharacterized protein n=1 Tax=Rhizobium tibeticum TaxID=501024 RepID=A0A1H8JZD0_9HYPH|nr:hypothetical protein [Rhizobium tibeticum]SEH78493.1 hypothetical protein RTCCBAU85039_2339 [Rhizobium tibeticum]SEN86042.1 hypothetical protein SAMN05216228_1008119 [Rhizobium tibeticum]